MQQSEDPTATTIDELNSMLDRLGPSEILEAHALLSRSYAVATTNRDADLKHAIQAEGMVLELFTHAQNLSAALADHESAFTADQRAYLMSRFQTTGAPHFRGRYGHAVAWATRRFDIGQDAADAYITAVDSAVDTLEPIDRERALRALAPLTLELAKRYRKVPEASRVLARALQSSAAILRLEILALLVPEPKLDRAVRERLRQPLFDTIAQLAGTSALERMVEAAELGARLDAKLGNSDSGPWHRALLEGLKKTVAAGEHPLLREHAAQQAARILQLLGADEERAEMIAIQRELAVTNIPTFSHCEPIDEDGTFGESVRASLDARLPEMGEAGILGYLGISLQWMPQMSHAREALAQQRAEGIGIFRQLVTTEVRSRDHRVIGHGAPGAENDARAIAEQFGYGCIYAWYAMDVAARHLIANGTVRREHFAEYLGQTWIAQEESGRENQLPALLLAPLAGYIDVITGVQLPEAIIPVIDSLTLRFEAVLRKFARLLRVSDTKEITDERGRLITEVLGLNALLSHERMKAALGEDLHALMRRTLLGEDEGLRHSIGHAIMDLTDYNIFTAHGLVFLLLRFSMHQGEAIHDRDDFPAKNSGLP